MTKRKENNSKTIKIKEQKNPITFISTGISFKITKMIKKLPTIFLKMTKIVNSKIKWKREKFSRSEEDS